MFIKYNEKLGINHLLVPNFVSIPPNGNIYKQNSVTVTPLKFLENHPLVHLRSFHFIPNILVIIRSVTIFVRLNLYLIKTCKLVLFEVLPI